MKSLIAILSIIMLFGFYACNENSTDTPTKSKTELLTRTWVLDSAYRDGELQSELIGNRIEFSKNLRLTMYLKTGEILFQGDWSLNEKTNIVEINIQKDTSHTSNYSFVIDELKENSLIWRYTDAGYLFREVYSAYTIK